MTIQTKEIIAKVNKRESYVFTIVVKVIHK